MPDAASQVPQLYPPPPTCLDQQPMKVECEKRVEVQVLKPHFFLPVDLPWPKVIDNDPFYLITSDLPNVSKNPYYFDGSIKHFQWVVTDRDGHAVTCDVDVIYKDEVSPVMDCPRVVIDMVPNTISRNTTLRLPDIPVVDTSTVHFVTSPQNGSTVSIDQPVLVNVTAIDWFGNAKLCQFWYQAKVADCPVWMINDGAFLCTMTEGISVCYFQISSKCILSRNLKALACKPGFGWRIIENNVEVNHFDKFPVLDVLPTCLEETEPSIAATVVFSSPDNLIGCVNESAKLLSVTNASLTECCSNIRWTFVSMKESKNDFLLTFLSNAKSESQLKECSNLLSASLSKRLTIVSSPYLPSNSFRTSDFLQQIL
ncbi:hypothetical protein L596_005082 [Steinernema carpocapsae]|uniref:HYR domain-containing protein n=1 Tax=Steinernema carpocapsae TaxID=34508 RepID=A0A4U8UZC5_STECR|nr:hypothetical protein L596_005082 [Steinernema carpocapsae]